MSSRRLVVGVFPGFLVASILLTACAAPKQTAPVAVEPRPATSPADVSAQGAARGSGAVPPLAGGAAPSIDSEQFALDAAQRRAEQFAQALQPAMTRRAPGASSSQTLSQSSQTLSQPSQTHPSQVRWGDPVDFRLSSSPVDPASREGGPVVVHGVAYKPGSVDVNKPASPAEGAPVTPYPANSQSALGKGAVTTNAPLSLTESPEAAVAPQASPGVRSDLYTLEQRLATRVREYPRDIAGQLEYQLLLYLMDQPVPQLAPLAGMPSEDRELLSAIMDGLGNFRSTVRSDNNMLLSKKIRPILDLADRVRTQADLTIGNVSLCKSVRGFGDYDPIEPLRFAAGQEAKFITYCEVSNFASTLNEKKRWETRLSLELVVYTENGMQVWSAPPETINESARVRRQDFFLVRKVALPASLAIGRYMLKVTVVDNQVNRVSEATVPVIIGAK